MSSGREPVKLLTFINLFHVHVEVSSLGHSYACRPQSAELEGEAKLWTVWETTYIMAALDVVCCWDYSWAEIWPINTIFIGKCFACSTCRQLNGTTASIILHIDICIRAVANFLVWGCWFSLHTIISCVLCAICCILQIQMAKIWGCFSTPKHPLVYGLVYSNIYWSNTRD